MYRIAVHHCIWPGWKASLSLLRLLRLLRRLLSSLSRSPVGRSLARPRGQKSLKGEPEEKALSPVFGGGGGGKRERENSDQSGVGSVDDGDGGGGGVVVGGHLLAPRSRGRGPTCCSPLSRSGDEEGAREGVDDREGGQWEGEGTFWRVEEGGILFQGWNPIRKVHTRQGEGRRRLVSQRRKKD